MTGESGAVPEEAPGIEDAPGIAPPEIAVPPGIVVPSALARSNGWRVEADEAWLAEHRSDNFGRLRRRLKRWGVLANAVSNAEMGPFAGAPRNPTLKLGGRSYSVVRQATQRFAYTAIQVDPHECRRCGQQLVEVHQMRRISENGLAVPVGAVWMCRRCEARSWLFHSEMPAVVRARIRDRRVVL
jgi:ribosomal protein L37E